MFKREILKAMYDQMNGCTLLINPTNELRSAYLNMSKDLDSLVKLFGKYSLPTKLLSEFQNTAISIYVPTFHQDGRTCMMAECFAVSIDCNNLKKEGIDQAQFGNIINTIVEKLSIEVLDYIQFNLAPVHICKLLNIDEYVKNYGQFSLKDFVEIAAGSQKNFVESLEISKTHLSEIVSGKRTVPLTIIKKIHKVYPLFPIEIFLGE